MSTDEIFPPKKRNPTKDNNNKRVNTKEQMFTSEMTLKSPILTKQNRRNDLTFYVKSNNTLLSK